SFLRSRHTVALIAGEPGDVSVISTIDERRRIPDRARIAFMNGATQFEPLEVFLVPPGTDVSNFSSAVVLDVPGMSTRISVQPGEYEILLRDSDTNVVVAGPAPVTVDGGGLYTVLAVNGDPGTVDLVYLEDFVE